MTYTVKHTNPLSGPDILLAPLQVDTTSTSINLWGRGAINWGTLEQNNFLHMLENFSSPSSPPHPTEGQLWFDTSDSNNKVLRVYRFNTVTNVGTWATASGVRAGTTFPSPAEIGDLWFDLNTSQLMVCTAVNADVWTPVSLCVKGNTAPASPLPGQLWFNTLNSELEYWNGTQWQVVLGNNDSTTAPLAPHLGQLWFDTNHMILNFWNGHIWEPLTGTIDLPGQPDGQPHGPLGLPVGYAVSRGQFWFNSTNSTIEFFDGTNWQVPGVVVGYVAPANPRHGQFWLDSADDSLKFFDANGEWQTIATMYTGVTAPTPAKLGQLWFNPTTQKLMVYNGTTWINVANEYVAGNGIKIENNVISAVPKWAIGLIF